MPFLGCRNSKVTKKKARKWEKVLLISFYLCNLVTHKGNDASLAKQEFPFIDTDSDIDSILNHKPIVCCLLRSESKLHKQSGNRKETVFFSFFVIVALLSVVHLFIFMSHTDHQPQPL